MSLRCPDLPFLPGFTFNPMIGRTKFNMDPKFDFISKGVPALVEKVKPNMFGPLSDKYPSVYPRGEVLEVPAWIAYDKQILCFDAFFKETLQEVRNSPFQVRKVKIYFFLEDGTITVVEPKVENSGVAQGTLICRHRIRFPPPMDDNFYEMIDLNVGREVEFYGRVFKITNCDKFTRNFLNRNGIPVPDPLDTPSDPYMDIRRRTEEIAKKTHTRKEHPFQRFLKNDKKILRFKAYWDDQDGMYGYLHVLEIFYYLSDDTIEIKETLQEACKPTNNFTFLKRGKLPKTYKELPKPGAHSNTTILNVLGSGLQGGRYTIDPLGCGQDVVEFYKETDFAIGSVINCYGRKMVLIDCDSFTKEFYKSKYGIDNFEPLPLPMDNLQGISVSMKDRKLPPWNGYGSFEDSAQNCITVEPKAPHKDFKKFLELDRLGLDSHVLRFEARMISKIPENCTREFVISYYMADDTIGIHEFARRNSGFSSHQFLARGPVLLPGQDLYARSEPPERYMSQDMYIGATLDINGFKFMLINADEYALRYMELHPEQYPKSNIKLIMSKIREKLRPTYKDFVAENMPKETGSMTYTKLKSKLCELLGDDFTEHEMITISRAFPAEFQPEDKYNREQIRAITLTELKRYLWDDLARLREYFIMRDPERTHKLPKNECYIVLRACRLPLEKELVERILQVAKKDENCLICYNDIIDFVNRDVCPPPDVEPINIKSELKWDNIPEHKAITLIDWCAFNKYLDLEDTFKETRGPNTANVLAQN